MSADPKPVAKSLHTVTVLEQVAILHMGVAPGLGVEASLDYAMGTLDLSGRPDPYGLRDRVLANLIRRAS